MVNWSKDELDEYQAKLTKGKKSQRLCADCKRAVVSGKHEYCPACKVKRQGDAKNKHYEEVMRPARNSTRRNSPKPHGDYYGDAPIDDGDGTINKCPDCGAAYDPTATASRGSNKRQFTRKETPEGIDFDYFECFCKPSNIIARYK